MSSGYDTNNAPETEMENFIPGLIYSQPQGTNYMGKTGM